jgi:hypothetical protein
MFGLPAITSFVAALALAGGGTRLCLPRNLTA